MKPTGMGQHSATFGADGMPVGRAPDPSAAQWVMLVAAVFASLSLLGWVLSDCRSGFDFTDEGFYLNWISNPWNYPASVSQFGFVYHPLYVLLGSDVVLLRQANVLILFGLAWLLCGALFGSIRGQDAAVGARAGFACSALVAASAALLFLQVWLPTPSYNSLTLQSMMLAVTGGLLAECGPPPRSVAGWLMIGIGCGLAFLAKPPSAATLGALLAIYLAVTRRFRPSGVLIAVVTAGFLVAVAAFAIDGSLAGFFRRVVEGLDLSNRRLGFAHTAGRLLSPDRFVLGNWQWTHYGFLTALFVTTGLGLFASRFARPISVLSVAAAAATCVIVLVEFWNPQFGRDMMQPVQIIAILAAVLVELVASRPLFRIHSRSSYAVVGLLLALPCAFAFGTASGFWPTAAHAALFWFLAALVLCLDHPREKVVWQRLLPGIALALIASAGTLFVATAAPYRQLEALNRQHSVIDLPPGGSRILVSEQVANYIRALRQLAVANGFKQGDAVLDLTGETPGSLYAIGARPLAAPWTLGGYPGSAEFVAAALDQETCKMIASSWLLDEPGSTAAIPADVLAGQGAGLSIDYAVVGAVDGIRGLAPWNVEYRLLKPARSSETAEASCQKSRRG